MPQKPVIFLSEIPSDNPAGEFRFQALREGHWTYQGEALDVTPALLRELKTNFDKKLYCPVPVDGPVDGGEAHSDSDAHDCGFVKSLELSDSDTKLWATVHLTNKKIAEKVDEGSIAYCSSEFMLGWSEPEQGQTLNVFSGLGLTNRPFIKNMAPAERVRMVNFSEYFKGGEMPEDKTEIETLQREIAELKKAQVQTVSLSEKAIKLEEANKTLLAERNAFEHALKTQEATGTLEKFEQTLRSACEDKGSLSIKAANAAYALAQAIVLSGTRKVELSAASMQSMDNGGDSIYRGNASGMDGIRKCDLIDMLTETINALPGDVVHVTPTGKGYGDEDADDEDGQVKQGHGGSEGDDTGKFKFSERFKEVKPKSRGVTADGILAEAKALALSESIGISDALSKVLRAKGIKNISEVKD